MSNQKAPRPAQVPDASRNALAGNATGARMGGGALAGRAMGEASWDDPGGEVAAFDAAPDPMAMFTPDGVVLYTNAAFRALFRFVVTPTRPPWGRVTPPPFEGADRQFEAAAPDGCIYEWRERRLPDGRRIASARDVTARIAAAAGADRAKTSLFATLTHELRTPLNGVLGMAGLLDRTSLDASQKEFVTALRRSGEHLLDLITEILDFSRIEAGRIVLDDAPFSPEAVLQDVAELLSTKAFEKRLDVCVRVAPGVPDTLRGDAGRLRQVLFNLVGNAVKFTEAGGVAMTMTALGGGRYAIAVRDTGPGVPEDKQALIFEEFAQADVSHARLHGGAGLGLAIVRKLIGTMGGSVSVSSRVGQGATFTVEAPFAAMEAARDVRPLKGVRAHVISANAVLATETIATLMDLGAEAFRADPGARGVDSDVILLDHAPGSTPPLRLPQSAPVIVMAPQEERQVVAAYQARGASHYLLKPLRRRSLLEQVRAAVSRAPLTAASVADEREADFAREGALTGLRVLVADDNPINALLARTLLSRAGASVQVVSDGEAAMKAVLGSSAPFDLAFLDVRMPVMDGLAAARAIRAGAGEAARTPLIALTADSFDEDRKAAMAAGMDDFITKPIDLDRLVRTTLRFARTPETSPPLPKAR